jgi:hypothetical protein
VLLPVQADKYHIEILALDGLEIVTEEQILIGIVEKGIGRSGIADIAKFYIDLQVVFVDGL